MTSEQDLSLFFRLLKDSAYCVAFSGAGISTLAGIQDFRGKNGLYKQPNTEKMFDIAVFRQNPSVYYTMAKDFIYGLSEKKPAVVHRVLAQLEEKGKLQAVITQNIDLLHQKAGSKRLIEVHGSPSIHSCPACGSTKSFEEVVPVVQAGELPRCSRCNTVLKPDITFFGENLPLWALEAAQDEASKADLLLVLGSSLLVHPAAELPLYTLRNGGKLVLVNDTETYLDSKASLCLPDLAQAFDYLESRMEDF